MNESFWDAHGVEIGACAIFAIFPDPANYGGPDSFPDSMLGVTPHTHTHTPHHHTHSQSGGDRPGFGPTRVWHFLARGEKPGLG